jgi:hypothetical protein
MCEVLGRGNLKRFLDGINYDVCFHASFFAELEDSIPHVYLHSFCLNCIYEEFKEAGSITEIGKNIK